MKNHLIFLMLCILLVAACSANATPSPVPSTSSAMLQASPTAPSFLTPLPTPTATLVVQPNVAPTRSAMGIGDPKMLSPTEGWALGWGHPPMSVAVLHTMDGGTSWRNVTPTGPLFKPFILDLQNAWVAAEVGVLYRTRDGGQTWTFNNSITKLAGTPWALFFLDQNQGWLLQKINLIAPTGSSGDNRAFMETALYTTGDGGENWQLLSRTASEPTPMPNSTALPFDGFKGGVSFRDTKVGWITTYSGIGGAGLFITRDGGRTWQRQVTSAGGLFQAPKFFTAKDGLVLVSGFVLVTGDGGESWERIPSSLSWDAASFTSVRNGWVGNPLQQQRGGKLYRTQDSGRNWVEVEPDEPSRQLLYKKVVQQIHFVNDQIGWAVQFDQFITETSLLKTINGGRSWSLIDTIIYR